MPSFTLDEGILVGLKPALVQWKKPLGHAEVPRNTNENRKNIIIMYNTFKYGTS